MFEITIQTDNFNELIRFGKALAAMDSKPKPEQKPEKKPVEKKEPKPRVPIDTGKIHALKNAGWPVAKIADEMDISVATVYSKLNQPYKGGKEQ